MEQTTEARRWSAQQVAIFDWFKGGAGGLVVRARAGTGKTTTILHGISFAPERRILLGAFNKRIADELSERLQNPSASAKTFHSIGFGIVRRMWESVLPEKSKGGRAGRLAQQACGEQAPDAMIRLVAKLHTLGREMAPFAESGIELSDIAWEHECVPAPEWEDLGWGESEVCQAAYTAMQLAALKPADGEIDYADMLYLPLANKWARPSFDLVVVDEAQDMNRAQLELARRICRGRICFVGDDRQAIYRFRGADSGSIDRLKSELGCAELGLTTTYRCGKAIVAEAKRLVPDFDAAPTNPEGEVLVLSDTKLMDEVMVGDAVLSRKNAPLVGWCLLMLRRGISARVEGKDIAAGLRALVRELAQGRGRNSVPAFLASLLSWEAKEVARAMKSGEAGADRAASVRDRAEAIRYIAEGVSGVPEMLGRIEEIFQDISAARCVVLSSVHKAKGLEWSRVFLLEDTFRGGDDEEDNVEYVAITRAKDRLYRVYSPKAVEDEQQGAKN